jgi:hypothetical protein
MLPWRLMQSRMKVLTKWTYETCNFNRRNHSQAPTNMGFLPNEIATPSQGIQPFSTGGKRDFVPFEPTTRCSMYTRKAQNKRHAICCQIDPINRTRAIASILKSRRKYNEECCSFWTLSFQRHAHHLTGFPATSPQFPPARHTAALPPKPTIRPSLWWWWVIAVTSHGSQYYYLDSSTGTVLVPVLASLAS